MEMVVGTTGVSIMSRKLEYEFDPMGNWTADDYGEPVYENGKK